MTDLTIDLPGDFHDRLTALAALGDVELEDLVRQIITVGVGVNTSTREDPFSSLLLRKHPERLLDLATAKPVFVRDKDHGDFVIVSDRHYEQYVP